MPTHRRASLVPWMQRLRLAQGDREGIFQLVREAEQGGCSDLQLLAEVYGVAVEMFTCERRSTDAQFGLLCVKCLRALCHTNPADAREFFIKLRTERIGQLDARLYETRAAMEERLGDSAKATRLLQEGLKMGAEPAELLRRGLSELVCGPPEEVSDAGQRLSHARDGLVRLLQSARGREVLVASFTSWRLSLQDAQQGRREALFDAMSSQVQAARVAAAAAEQRCEKLQGMLSKSREGALQEDFFAAWLDALQLARDRRGAAELLGRATRRSQAVLFEAALVQILFVWQHAAAAAASRSVSQLLLPIPGYRSSPHLAQRLVNATSVGVMVDCLLEDLALRSPQSIRSPLRRPESANSRNQQASQGTCRPESASSRSRQPCAAGRAESANSRSQLQGQAAVVGNACASPTRACRRPPDVQVNTALSRWTPLHPSSRLSASVPHLPGGACCDRSESPSLQSPGRLWRARTSAVELGAPSVAASTANLPSSPSAARPPPAPSSAPAPAPAPGQRSPLADVSRQQSAPLILGVVAGDGKASVLMAAPPASAGGRRNSMRGPERFYYDKSSYTGCARFGGPSLADGKENGPASLRPNLNRPTGKPVLGGSVSGGSVSSQVGPPGAAVRRRAVLLR